MRGPAFPRFCRRFEDRFAGFEVEFQHSCEVEGHLATDQQHRRPIRLDPRHVRANVPEAEHTTFRRGCQSHVDRSHLDHPRATARERADDDVPLRACGHRNPALLREKFVGERLVDRDALERRPSA
jgi:hypothetical protein